MRWVGEEYLGQETKLCCNMSPPIEGVQEGLASAGTAAYRPAQTQEIRFVPARI